MKIAEIRFNEKNETIIPEGYKWCNLCEALTPHEGNDGNVTCAVCDEALAQNSCPKCGCNEEYDVLSVEEVVVHEDGCERKSTKCRCQKHVIIKNINKLITDLEMSEQKEIEGVKFPVATWMKYKVRCRVCAHVYEGQTGWKPNTNSKTQG